MEIITLQRRVRADDGGSDRYLPHVTLGARVGEVSESEQLALQGDVSRRLVEFSVVNSPLMRKLPADVDGLLYGGQQWRIRRIDRGKRTARRIVITAEES